MSVAEVEPRCRVGLTGSSVWVCPVGAGPACGRRGRAAGSGSPFGSGCVRSWAGGLSGSCTGWVTSVEMVSGLSAAASAPDVEDARTSPKRPARSAPIRTRPSSTRRPSGWSGFAFLRARAAAVRGRALAPPVGFGRVGGVSAEAAMASSTCAAPSDAAAPAVFDRRNRGAWGDRGVRLSAVGLGVPAVVVGVEPRRRADGAPRRLSGPCGPPCDGDDTDVLCSAPDAGTRRASRCRGCARSRPRSAVATGRPLVGAGSAGVVPS